MSAIGNLLDSYVDGTNAGPAVVQKMGIGTIDEWKPGYVKKTWLVSPDCFIGTTLFGGYIAALADQMLAFAAITLQGKDEYISTSNMSISYLKAVVEGDLMIEAEVMGQTRKSFYVEVTFRQKNILVAKATATQLTIGKEKY